MGRRSRGGRRRMRMTKAWRKREKGRNDTRESTQEKRQEGEKPCILAVKDDWPKTAIGSGQQQNNNKETMETSSQPYRNCERAEYSGQFYFHPSQLTKTEVY